MRLTTHILALSSALLAAAPVMAQANPNTASPDTISRPTTVKTPTPDSAAAATAAAPSLVPKTVIQHIRVQDQRGINLFESPKNDPTPFTGFQLSWGAAFTQQFQGLSHQNAASQKIDPITKVDANQLMSIGNGFNTASANLYLNAQIAPGIRVALTSYLSSRHHNETWVKDGYLLIDESPIKVKALETLMDYVSLKLGHFEINYGDSHFRRTDNGNAMYNSFVGNMILDPFTTEVGGEAYVRANGFMGMLGITGGEIRGQVSTPAKRSPAFYGKTGFDRQLTQNLRLRLTGSLFSQTRSANQTLFAGDRAGSRYYLVVENTVATESAQKMSGMFDPGFGSAVHSYQINPFLKYRGLELFGVAEKASGMGATETVKRSFDQYDADVVYRFLKNEKMYVGARYNTVQGRFKGFTSDASADRTAFSGGWFITPILLMKGEWVTQKYNDFPTADIRNGAKFHGFMVEGVVAF